jgi:ribonuclease P protein component
MQVLKKEDAPSRFGLTASRKVGNAPARNRARRRLREMVRAFGPLPDGFDVVLIAKTIEKERDFALMRADFLKGLKETGVLP